MFQGGEVGGGMVGAQAAFVVSKDHLEDSGEAVLDAPMIVHEGAIWLARSTSEMM